MGPMDVQVFVMVIIVLLIILGRDRRKYVDRDVGY